MVAVKVRAFEIYILFEGDTYRAILSTMKNDVEASDRQGPI